jgi:hypothetical protein
MKKCKFCDHRAFTDRGEEVCTKYLWYVGDDREDLPCEEFEIALGWQPIAFLVVCVLVIALMVSLL